MSTRRCSLWQIARIAATTVLSPAGYFTAGEEGEIEKNEEFQAPEPRELGTPSNWCHRHVETRLDPKHCDGI